MSELRDFLLPIVGFFVFDPIGWLVLFVTATAIVEWQKVQERK